MKRLKAFVLVGVAGALAAGCPVYSENDDAWCADYRTCQPGEDCYQWPCNSPPGWGGTGGSQYFGGGAGYSAAGGHGGSDAGAIDAADGATEDARPDTDAQEAQAADAEAQAAVYCAKPADCASGTTCGPDGTCHPGDCGATPCINGFVCQSTTNGLGCAKADPRGCESDAECTGTDACVDGVCAPAGSLCTDRTQCPPGSACVDGKCVVECGEAYVCPEGYGCFRTSLLCAIVAHGCSITADCGSASLACVDYVCVPRCSARGSCGPALAGSCVDNGCIPSQKVVAQCAGDGVQGGCAAGQICLHQHCYTSCAGPDGGAGAACAQPGEDVCKPVTTAAGTFSVCGSVSSLGSECDRTLGQGCASGKICVDGFCRSGP
jgi:hypothetical protein